MKTELIARDDQQTKLIAELDVETFEKYKHQAARRISQKQKFPGFRPGKAPYDLVRRMVGDDALQQEAVDLMLDTVYPEAIRDANLTPSGPGKLDEIVSMDPPTFSFIVPLPPEVDLGDYKAIRKDYQPEPITDEQVETTLKNLQRTYATAEPVERAAQTGDLVSFELSAVRTQPEEDENANLVEKTPYQMIAGEEDEDQQPSWPYEGFSQELVGMSAGETKKVVHTFDDESPYENLRGKDAEFTIVVESVKEMHSPELTDEFAQTLGDFENVDALRNAVRSQLEQTSAQQYDQNYFDELIDTLIEQSTIKYPPHMLDDEIEAFMTNLQQDLERDHLDLDTYLKMREMDRDTFIEKEVKQAAEHRLMHSLVLEEFAKRENLDLKDEEIQSIFDSAIQQSQLQGTGKGRSRSRQSTQDMANSIAVNTVNSIFNMRLMNRLKAIATGKGDEPEQQPEAETEPGTEAVLDENIEAEAVTGSESGLGEVQMNSITNEREAEEEQADAEEDLLTEESPQGDEGTGESNPENQD